MRKHLNVVLVLLFVSAAAFGQEHRFDVSFGGTYAIYTHASENGIDQDPTNAFGFLGTVRARFGPHHSFQFNYGHTRNSQNYTAPPFQFAVQSVQAEFSGSYIYNFAPRGKFEPFVTVGAGALVFTPEETFVNDVLAGFGATREYRPAFLYSGGFDYPIYKRFSARVQYRGLVYSNPDFNVSRIFVGGKAHTAEPGVGIVFKF